MKRLMGLLAFLLVFGLALPAQATSTTVWHMDSLPPEQGSIATRNGGVLSVVTPGFAGNAYLFDGNEKLLLPDDPSLDPGTADFSVEVHVKTTTVPDDVVGDFDLIRKGLAGDGRYWKVELFPNKANTAAFAFCQMRGFNSSLNKLVGVRLKYTGANLADGLWHDIVCTKTATNVTLAVDGKVRITNTHVVGDISNTKALSIGSKPTNWDDAYIGEMDEVTYAIS